jgi:hypothetical protein
MRRTLLPIALALAAPVPAFAQATPAAQAAPSPELAAARQVVLRLIPSGTYKKVMSGSMGALMDNMGETMKALPLKQIAQLGGLSEEEAKALDKVDVARIMSIYDPHWQERTSIGMRAMFDAMGDFFTTFEPELREAMARAYANQFTLAELQDLDRYLSTPTGSKFAARSMTVMTDPAVIDATKAMMPKMMAQMPVFIEAMTKATAKLPPPRKIQDLTQQEKDDLARAMGIDPKKLQDPKSRI